MGQTIAIKPNEKVLSHAKDLIWVFALAGLTTIAAKIRIALPWTPVPITLQTTAVIFAGLAFGSKRGALAQLVYLSMGLLGLPVFATPGLSGPAVILMPTFGYVLAFPAAAWLAGCFKAQGRHWLAAALALGMIYLLGTFWLMMWSSASGHPISLWNALGLAVLPYLLVDAVKTVLAVLSAEPFIRRPRVSN